MRANKMTDRDFIVMCSVIRAEAMKELVCQHRKEYEMEKQKMIDEAKKAEETLWKGANKAAKAIDKGLNTYNGVCLEIEKKLFGEPLDAKLDRWFAKIFK
jgi:hypothetical protein